MATNYNPTPWRSDAQNYLIAQWFINHPNQIISAGQALDLFGTMKLATRISEIKATMYEKYGVQLKINSVFHESAYSPRSKYKVYWVDNENQEKLKNVFL